MAADSTIPSEHVILLNHWPRAYLRSFFNSPPPNGFVGEDHFNVAVPKFQVGAMITMWNDGTGDGVEGWYTMMYARNKTTAIAAGLEVCQPADAEAPYYISSTVGNALIVNDISMLGAVSIAAMTIAYYGWFWVEGVAPSGALGLIDTFPGDLPTAGTAVVLVGQACIGAGDTPAKGVLRAQTASELDGPFAWCYEDA